MQLDERFRGHFAFPTDVIFGPGSLRTAGPELASLGRKALIVSDEGLKRAGVVESLSAILRASGVSYEVFTGVRPNPHEDDVEAGLTAYQDAGADFWIGLGGGSPLDAAKVMRLRASHPGRLEEYEVLNEGWKKIQGPLAPMVAIPTTAGTGSEVSRSAVIGLRDSGRKAVFFSPRLLPTLGICDPELTVGLGARLTAATGADALTHAVEAYLARGFHPVADALALQAVTYVFRYLRRAVINPRDIEARSYMMLASMFGAMAFQKGLGSCHSMAHALTALHHTHHGLANGVFLPHVVAFNADTVPERIRELARASGNNLGLLSNGKAAGQFIGDLKLLFTDAGLPSGMREAGVHSPDYPGLVSFAMGDGCRRDNPRDTHESDFSWLFRAAA